MWENSWIAKVLSKTNSSKYSDLKLPKFKNEDLKFPQKQPSINFSTTTAAKGLNPDAKEFFESFSDYAKKLGHPVKVAPEGGFRTAEMQNKIYKRNKPGYWVTSMDGYRKKSIHQSGLALDIISTQGYKDSKENAIIAKLLRKYASQHSNKWSFRFIAKDPNHVEINREKYGLGKGAGSFKHGYLEL